MNIRDDGVAHDVFYYRKRIESAFLTMTIDSNILPNVAQ